MSSLREKYEKMRLEPKPLLVRNTRAGLVTLLASACEAHRATGLVKRIAEDPKTDSTQLKDDDFATMMKLRRQRG